MLVVVKFVYHTYGMYVTCTEHRMLAYCNCACLKLCRQPNKTFQLMRLIRDLFALFVCTTVGQHFNWYTERRAGLSAIVELLAGLGLMHYQKHLVTGLPSRKTYRKCPNVTDTMSSSWATGLSTQLFNLILHCHGCCHNNITFYSNYPHLATFLS